jgi:hypothetical protein
MKRDTIKNGFSFTDYREQMEVDKMKLKSLLIKGGMDESIATVQADKGVNKQYLAKYGALKDGEQKVESACGALANARETDHQVSLAKKKEEMKAIILSHEPDQAKAAIRLKFDFSRVNEAGANAVIHKGIAREIALKIARCAPGEELDAFLSVFYQDKARYTRLINTLKNTLRQFLEHYTMTPMVQDSQK